MLALGLASPCFPDSPCARCHADEVAAYERTGMGRSLGRPAEQPGGVVTHALSGSQVTITSDESGMRHKLERGGLSAEYEVPYFVGSGNVGRSYIVSIKNRLYQSPVSYYSERGVWDMSPGFETDPNIDFVRPVTSQCLFCHSGRARPVPGTLNTYEDPPFAAASISCGRCHGPGEKHLADPSRHNIVNPKRLEPRARASVCEQCHLAGEERVVNPGRRESDFQAGMELEDVLSVYVRARPPEHSVAAKIKVVSHAEQLALSVCAKSAGDAMWCGSCHNPHETPRESAGYYRQKCLNCHGEALLETHASPADDCVGCHMQRRAASDVAHTAFTDHRILRTPEGDSDAPRPERLAPWRLPPEGLRERNLGLAYVRAGENHKSLVQLREGYRLLTSVQERFAEDPEVLTALGRALFINKTFERSVRRFEAALAADPGAAVTHSDTAGVYAAMGETAKAIAGFERAIELDPSLKDAYIALATLYGRMGQPEKREETIKRYLEFMPRSILAQEVE